MRLLLLFLVFFICLFQLSCKKYAQADAAFFIQPGTISVSTTLAQGTGSHKITDLWVYVNGFYKGAYATENLIPIVSNGKSVKLSVFAGVKNNGIKDTRIPYPFLELLEVDTFVDKGKTISRSFAFKYKSATTFTWSEGFEGQGFSLIKSAISDTGFTVASGPESFEGRYMHLLGSKTATLLQVESSGSGFGLPFATANVYLELNYKCNAVVSIGLKTDTGFEKEAFNLNPSSGWNKIYIALGSTVNQTPLSSLQKVYFRMLKAGDTVPELYLDNIRLLFLPS